jgi:hypothetical protein
MTNTNHCAYGVALCMHVDYAYLYIRILIWRVFLVGFRVPTHLDHMAGCGQYHIQIGYTVAQGMLYFCPDAKV